VGFQTMCFNVYISAYFLAEHGGCNQAIDAVTCQGSFPGYFAVCISAYFLAEHGGWNQASDAGDMSSLASRLFFVFTCFANLFEFIVYIY
jgi:hypothetical protein